jgi:hypothetical protein
LPPGAPGGGNVIPSSPRLFSMLEAIMIPVSRLETVV